MKTPRRYVVTDVPNGIHIAGRRHPLDVEGSPEWLVDFIHEHSDRRRVPITIVRDSLAFRLENWKSLSHASSDQFGLVDYYSLIDEVAAQVMREWSPPQLEDDDEKGPGELRGWHGVKEWALKQTAASINSLIHGRWKALLSGADPTALAVQKKVFSATFGYGKSNFVMSPEFYQNRFVVKDVLEFRAAAIAAGILGRIAYDADGLAEALDRMNSWRALFSPSNEAYTSLNKTLTDLSGGVPAHFLLKLRRFMLPRPITNRIELLTTILANERAPRNVRVFSFATEDQVREALRLTSNHLHRELSPRRWRDLREMVQFVGDYPEIHPGNLVGLAERSIRWHRDLGERQVEQFLQRFGPNTETALPPIPLPLIEGVQFLSTLTDLSEEGQKMEHCIASYAERAVQGNCFLFHVDFRGEQASVEVDWFGNVVQAYGPKNVKNAASQWGTKVLAKWGRGLARAIL